MSNYELKECTVSDIVAASNHNEIMAEYAEESSIKGLPTYAEQLPMYYMMESVGAICIYGAFRGTVLLGFVVILSSTMPHYGAGISTTESFFVSKAYRKHGVGSRLKRVAEKCAKEKGSSGILISTPKGGKLEAVLMRCKDYVQSNSVFFKSLV